MNQARAGVIVEYLRKLVAVGSTDPTPDRELLRRFACQHDEAAFTTLVQRHGPMILHVCQRLLHNRQDAEDVCQAVFFVLASKAAARYWHRSVANWLYQVAYHLALKAKATAACRRTHERRGIVRSPADPVEEITVRELQSALHEELARLPKKYRAPLVLCYLEGATRDEAARQLGWPLGTLKSRVERGRELLHNRLACRGLTLSAALSMALLTQKPAQAALPAGLTPGIVRAAFRYAAGQVPAGAAGIKPAVGLAHGMLKAMFLNQCKTAVVWFLGACLLIVATTGTALTIHEASATKEDAETRQAASSLATEGADSPNPPKVKQVRTDHYGDPLPSGALARLGTVRLRHGSPLMSIAFSPDGRILACGGSEETIDLWEVSTGKRLGQLRASEAFPPFWTYVLVLAFSSDGKRLAAASVQNLETKGDRISITEIRLWDLKTGKVLRKTRLGPDAVFALSADGALLAWAGRDHALRIEALPTGKLLQQLGPRPDGIASLRFLAMGRTLAVESRENAISFLDGATAKEMYRLRKDPNMGFPVFSPSGTQIASAGGPNGIILRRWDGASGAELGQARRHQKEIRAITYSPDGKTLAYAERDKAIYLCDAATGKEIRQFPCAGSIRSLAFSPDGKTLASAHWNHVIQLWEVATGKELLPLGGPQGFVHAVAFSPDGKILASAGGESMIRLWDPCSGKELRPLEGHGSYVECLDFSADGTMLASGSQDHTLRLWNLASGTDKLVGLQGGFVRSVAFSADRKFVFSSVGGDPTIRCWDVATRSEARSFVGCQDYAAHVAYSGDRKRLAVASFNRTISVREVADGKELCRFQWQNEVANSLALSPDGKTLAAGLQAFNPDGGYAECTIRVWDLATRAEQYRIAEPAGPASALTFSSDGKTLVSGSFQGAVRLWEVATGRERAHLVGHAGRVNSLALSPDGKMLASGSSDTTVLLWDVTGSIESQQQPLVELSPREFETQWSKLSNNDAQRGYRAICTLLRTPRQTVALLGQRLQPAAPPDRKRLARWIADLDHARFADRETASRELEKLGTLAEPAFRKVLQDHPSAEVRRRVEQLLGKLVSGVLPPETLRALRALEILERIGSPDARQLLEKVAKGAPRARQTQEAKASLQRLTKQSSGTP